MMKKRQPHISLGLLSILALFISSPVYATNSLSMTTYYPSPTGNYDNVSSNKINAENVSISTTSVGSTILSIGSNGYTPWSFANWPVGDLTLRGDWDRFDVYTDMNNDTAATAGFAVYHGGAPGSATQVFGTYGDNVGIGVTTPATKLQISGVGGTTVDLDVNGRIHTGDGTNTGGIWVNNAYTQFFGQIDANTMGMWNGAWRMAIDNGGNVGIGNNSPTSPLQIGSSFGLYDNSIAFNAYATGGGWHYKNNNVASLVYLDSGGNGGLTFLTAPVGAADALLNDGVTWNWNLPLYLAKNGNVGINNNAPGTKLDVTGLGGGNVDLRVNGRIQTGDGGTAGGMWVDSANSLFVGAAGAGNIGLFNNGAWRLNIDNSGTATFSNFVQVNGSERIATRLGTNNLDPDSGYLGGWAGGVHTNDVQADGNINSNNNYYRQGHPIFPLALSRTVVHVTDAPFNQPSCASSGQTESVGARLNICYADGTNCSTVMLVDPYCYNAYTPPTYTGGGCTTPFLFTSSKGKFYIENDIMETYKSQSYDVAKEAYEKSNGDPYMFRKDDFYKLSIRPDITFEGIKFLIKEIEPEESHIDYVRLLHIVAPTDADIFVDQESNLIKSVRPKTTVTPSACAFNNTVDCLKTISTSDQQAIETNKDDNLGITFNLNGLNTKNLYLAIDSWLLPKDKEPDQWIDDLKLFIVDPKHLSTPIRLRDLYSRVIKSRKYIYLGDALKGFTSPNFTLVINSQGHHFIDYLALNEGSPVSYKMEELHVTKALHSNGDDVLKNLHSANNSYAHIIRGEQLELTLQAPKLKAGANEADTYFFATTGFYNMLRTRIDPVTQLPLYPHIEMSFKGVYKDLLNYVDQLKEVSIHHSK